jgi:proteasome lid subunit RPN8/RPN11
VIDAIVAHAREAAPLECCGLLVGTPDRIDECVRMRNVDRNASRFRIDPEAHIQLNRRLRGTDRSVVGAYHSHPATSAEPSPTDIAESHYPEFVHLIASLADPARPSVRAFRITAGRASTIALLREPHAKGT